MLHYLNRSNEGLFFKSKKEKYVVRVKKRVASFTACLNEIDGYIASAIKHCDTINKIMNDKYLKGDARLLSDVSVGNHGIVLYDEFDSVKTTFIYALVEWDKILAKPVKSTEDYARFIEWVDDAELESTQLCMMTEDNDYWCYGDSFKDARYPIDFPKTVLRDRDKYVNALKKIKVLLTKLISLGNNIVNQLSDDNEYLVEYFDKLEEVFGGIGFLSDVNRWIFAPAEKIAKECYIAK